MSFWSVFDFELTPGDTRLIIALKPRPYPLLRGEIILFAFVAALGALFVPVNEFVAGAFFGMAFLGALLEHRNLSTAGETVEVTSTMVRVHQVDPQRPFQRSRSWELPRKGIERVFWEKSGRLRPLRLVQIQYENGQRHTLFSLSSPLDSRREAAHSLAALLGVECEALGESS